MQTPIPSDQGPHDFLARQKAQEALMAAAGRGDLDEIRSLMAMGARPGEVATGAGGEPMSPLGQAIESGKVEAVEIMAPFCDLSQPSECGLPPLHMAVEQAQPKVVAALLAAGADPQMLDRKGWTPLMLALQYGGSDCVDALLPTGDFQRRYPEAAAAAPQTVVDAWASRGQTELVDRTHGLEAEREGAKIRAHLSSKRSAVSPIPSKPSPSL